MSTKTNFSEVTVIIRSVGERTTDLCRELIISQGVNENNLTVVSVSPFSEALRKCYEIGIKKGRKWTLCVDADVLSSSISIKSLVDKAGDASDNVFEIQPLVCDWLFGGIRTAGVHLYRTSLLNKALDLVPRSEESLRPENYVLKKMKLLGFPYIVCDVLFGLHDFEQSYLDIYRKCYLQGKKHVKFTALLFGYWQANITKDFDCAILGFSDGLKASNVIATSKVPNELDIIEKLPREKNPIESGTYLPDKIDALINDFQESKAFKAEFISGYRFLASNTYLKTFISKYRGFRKIYGPVKSLIVLLLIALEFIVFQLKKRT